MAIEVWRKETRPPSRRHLQFHERISVSRRELHLFGQVSPIFRWTALIQLQPSKYASVGKLRDEDGRRAEEKTKVLAGTVVIRRTAQLCSLPRSYTIVPTNQPSSNFQCSNFSGFSFCLFFLFFFFFNISNIYFIFYIYFILLHYLFIILIYLIYFLFIIFILSILFYYINILSCNISNIYFILIY